MKIWAKVYLDDKIIRDTLYESDYPLTQAGFSKILPEVSYLLDIATPIALPTHFKHFYKFNRAKFLPRDFIEDVDFTYVVFELVTDLK